MVGLPRQLRAKKIVTGAFINSEDRVFAAPACGRHIGLPVTRYNRRLYPPDAATLDRFASLGYSRPWNGAGYGYPNDREFTVVFRAREDVRDMPPRTTECYDFRQSCRFVA
jgi:hypothetical protein